MPALKQVHHFPPCNWVLGGGGAGGVDGYHGAIRKALKSIDELTNGHDYLLGTYPAMQTELAKLMSPYRVTD